MLSGTASPVATDSDTARCVIDLDTAVQPDPKVTVVFAPRVRESVSVVEWR